MLKICTAVHQIDMAQLMQVYKESCETDAEDYHRCLSRYEREMCAYQDFLDRTREFFSVPGALYAVWAPEGRYKAALRLEPYQDGLVLAGLETAPETRRRGYATLLVSSVIGHLAGAGGTRVYSHVDKSNTASVKLHNACGFTVLKDHAVFLDGSVSQRFFTFFLQI